MELIVQKSSTKLIVVGFAWKLAGVGGIALLVVIARWVGAACRYWRLKVISPKVLC